VQGEGREEPGGALFLWGEGTRVFGGGSWVRFAVETSVAVRNGW
jgi:hypothetical protein